MGQREWGNTDMGSGGSKKGEKLEKERNRGVNR